MTAVALQRLQRWFLACATHPQGAAAAMALAAPTHTAMVDGGVLAPNPRLSPAAMLQIYHDGIAARFLEVMRADYPCVQHVLGETRFAGLVARYAQAHPSRHPNLNQFGRHFPAFVRRQGLARSAFVAELATLERALADAFDASEFTPLAAHAIHAVPSDRQGETRFTPNPSLLLLASRFPIDAFYQAYCDGSPMPAPCTQHSWLAVYRRGDHVHRLRLCRPQFAVLQALAAGRPLGEALALAKGGEPVADWFRDFTREGLFVALE